MSQKRNHRNDISKYLHNEEKDGRKRLGVLSVNVELLKNKQNSNNANKLKQHTNNNLCRSRQQTTK